MLILSAFAFICASIYLRFVIGFNESHHAVCAISGVYLNCQLPVGHDEISGGEVALRRGPSVVRTAATPAGRPPRRRGHRVHSTDRCRCSPPQRARLRRPQPSAADGLPLLQGCRLKEFEGRLQVLSHRHFGCRGGRLFHGRQCRHELSLRRRRVGKLLVGAVERRPQIVECDGCLDRESHCRGLEWPPHPSRHARNQPLRRRVRQARMRRAQPGGRQQRGGCRRAARPPPG